MIRILAALLFFTSAAYGQAVQQSGTVTPGHGVQWLTTGIIADSGGPPSGNPSITIGTTQITSGTDQGLLYDNNGVVGNLSTLNNGILVTDGSGVPSISTSFPSGLSFANPVFTGTVTFPDSSTWSSSGISGVLKVDITPPSGTTDQGLVTGSTAPSSGSQVGTFNFNEIDATNPGYTNTGSSFDGYGLLPAINGLRINLTSSGTNGTTIPAALTAVARAGGTSNPNLVGAQLTAYSNVSSSGDALWGGLGFVNIGASGVAKLSDSFDGESWNSGSVSYRWGISATSYGPNQASTLDSAFAIQQAGSSSPTPWVNGLTFASGLSGKAPLASTGNMIYSDGSFTTGCFACLSNVTFSNYLFNFADFAMNGSGIAVFGAGSASLPSAPNVVRATISSGGSVYLRATANGTSGTDDTETVDSTGDIQVFSGLNEGENTQTAFGVTVGGYAKFIGNGTSLAGMLIGTLTSEPLIIGTDNTNRLAMSGAGAITWTLGSDATGDIWYRNSSGNMTRLAIGNTGNSLVVSSGLPVWAGLTPPNVCDIVSTSATSCNNGGSAANDGTYTVPSGAVWLEITLVGAGGGGGGGNNATAGSSGGGTCWNTSGSACTSPVYEAGGGAGGNNAGGGNGGTISGSGTCSYSVAGGSGQYGGISISGSVDAGGGIGGNSTLGGAGVGSYNSAGANAASNSGSGGGGGGTTTAASVIAGYGGAAGATCKIFLSSLASSYTYAIGSGGGGASGGTDGDAGGNGASGHIIIVAH